MIYHKSHQNKDSCNGDEVMAVIVAYLHYNMAHELFPLHHGLYSRPN